MNLTPKNNDKYIHDTIVPNTTNYVNSNQTTINMKAEHRKYTYYNPIPQGEN